MQIASLDGEYKKMTTEMSKQREEIHREVDNAIHQMEKEICEIKVNHHSLLQKHLDEIKQLQSLMQQTLNVLNEMEESNEVSSAIHYSSKNEEFRKLPPKVNVSISKFVPKPIDREELCRVLQKTIRTKSGRMPYDIAVDKDGALLYSDLKTRTVYKVKNDQTEAIITLQGWKPVKLCVTSSGDLLVTIENRNLDICVADLGASAVVVVNQAGKLRFRYTGHPSPTKNKPFEPCGITTDSQGRILTADSDNNCIHIIDAHGHFLRYIDNCDLREPFGLCVDSDDSLFVGEENEDIVKKIRYLRC
uniref:Uncharacterized protein LOC111107773 n=1 Tax=Crassostrea virginica TaxID=6565 RepID=A0A8B8B6T0_CRAVI|nr:uncharacterized protein LOC111107773 [Crassostrea virginica]